MKKFLEYITIIPNKVDSDFEFDKNVIYILPKINNPVKIIYLGSPCPILYNLGIDHSCKYAKSRTTDLNFEIYCSIGKDKCDTIKFEGIND